MSVILNLSNFSGVTSGSPGASGKSGTFPGVQYLDIGLKVKATPRIHPDHEVTLQLDMESSTLSTSSFNTIPESIARNVSQTVRVKENETTALAGIIQSNLSNAIGGTPGIAGSQARA